MSKTTIIKRISPKYTLLSINIGETVNIKNSVLKCTGVRNAASRLNKKGYSFKVSDKGLSDSVNVTRLK